MVIWGISMPNHHGLAATREIRLVCPDIKILILTMHREKEYVDYARPPGRKDICSKKMPIRSSLSRLTGYAGAECYVSPLVAGGGTSSAFR